MPEKVVYAGYPSVVVYDRPDPKAGKAVQHCLWGDWMRQKEGRRDGWVEVHARGCDGWVPESGVQEERLLEVVFVDIGQGDGALVVTPDDRCLLVDAGVGDNMYRFLRWRFGKFKKPFRFHAAVISHPDEDHYGGFAPLFAEPNVRFGTVYHNGIVEQTGSGGLGPTTRRGRRSFLSGLVRDGAELAALLGDEARWKGKKYPTMLAGALADGKADDFRMLSHADGRLPDFDGALRFEVLGPVTEAGDDGRPWLRKLGSKGETKNGHSVVLRAVYRDVSILLGGDLNIPAEHHLLAHHTGLPSPPRTLEEREALIAAARRVFAVDVAKVCHHGSADFTSEWLDALNPLASVISSGDDEPHAHPRADTLGTLGRHSRGPRPLVFSTEVGRSAKETIKRPEALRERYRELMRRLRNATTDAERTRIEKAHEKELQKIERSVAVYGAVNVRTDGRQVVIAQKLERPRGTSKWDIYRLERQGNGPLAYVSKH